MAEMLNLSRQWNALCSVAIARRAIHEATEYLRLRRTFGRPAIEHGLVRETLADLIAEEIAAKTLVFTLIQHLADADAGDERAAALVRILTPLTKYRTAKLSVRAASEGIELVGGNGYIEDSPLPRLLRDAQVLPVWEGTTNILVLDGLRAVSKSGAHLAVFEEIRRRAALVPQALRAEAEGVLEIATLAEKDLAVIADEGLERAADLLKRCTDRLLVAYELALLLDMAAEGSPAGRTFAAALRRMLRRHLDPELRTSSEDLALLVDGAVASA
jgi:hypothetical protein